MRDNHDASKARGTRALRAGAAACLLGIGTSACAQPRVLDDFSTIDAWRVITPEGVRASIARDEAGHEGACLRLDFEFVTGGGYAIVQRDLPMDLPENYEFTFQCRAPDGTPENNLEFKLLDQSGDSVWWVNRRALAFPTRWKRLINKQRHIEFAWGPAAGTTLTRLRKIELVVASSSGGKGSVYFDDLAFRELPPSREYTGTPVLTATGATDGHAPGMAMDGDPTTGWVSAPLPVHRSQALTIDFGAIRELGGLSIRWDPQRRPATFDVLVSDDGRAWSPAYEAKATAPETNNVPTPDAECRFLRIDVRPQENNGLVGIREIVVRPPNFSEPNAMYATIAKEARRGLYPRYTLGEQGFWTVVGDMEGAEREALLSEDGAIEIDRRFPSIEPWLVVDGLALGWADGSSRVGLQQGYLPLPIVTREVAGLELTIRATAGPRVEYTVASRREASAQGSLVLAIRPFQVNPPTQWLNNPGGVAPTQAIHRHGDAIVVGTARIVSETPIARFAARTFDQGDLIEALAAGSIAWDNMGAIGEHASGAIAFDFDLGPGESATFAIGCIKPFFPARSHRPHVARGLQAAAWSEAAAAWQTALNAVTFELPASARPLLDVARSQIAFILINRDGPAIQPGSRSYERSWARDGSMTSAALLEFGFTDEVREWIEWFASHQFESGKVPCVVDKRGPDPVSEHDSHGQLIFAIANYYRYTRDSDFLRRMWPHVRKAVAYIESIRAERMTPEFAPGSGAVRQEPGKPAVPASAFHGLVPESISHEGYSAKPMHSYWDDFFVLLGLKEAAYIAGEVGDREAAERYAALMVDFRRTLLESIAAAQRAHGIDYIPGCVELGDFDATSTTVALWPCGEQSHLPPEALAATFERYWAFFERRRDDPTFTWKDYTPYENRIIGSFLRLGQRSRALALIDFFLLGQRPRAWNQWPEVVYRDQRTPGFLGDLPHTWCGSDFLNAFRAMFVYERHTPEGEALVLLAGVPEAWYREAGTEGLGFSDLPTPYGKVWCRATLEDGAVRVEVKGDVREPPGGMLVADPFDDAAPPRRLESVPGSIVFRRDP